MSGRQASQGRDGGRGGFGQETDARDLLEGVGKQPTTRAMVKGTGILVLGEAWRWELMLCWR